MKSFVGANRLQVELGVALLQLLHAAVNETGWEAEKNKTKPKTKNMTKMGKHYICRLDKSDK